MSKHKILKNWYIDVEAKLSPHMTCQITLSFACQLSRFYTFAWNIKQKNKYIKNIPSKRPTSSPLGDLLTSR